MIRYAIEEFAVFRGLIYCRGWCEQPNIRTLSILGTGPPEITAQPRLDLVPHYGPGAEAWGFELRSVLGGSSFNSVGLVITLADEVETVPCLAQTFNGRSDRGISDAYNLFLAEVRSHSKPRVLEIGSRARSGIVRKEMFGAAADYVGFDVVPGPNVDVVGDAHLLSSLVDRSFDFVFSAATFEHLLMPWIVATEIGKVLRVGGAVFVQAPQMWPVHDAPWDFFRFSTDAWKALFNRATGFAIEHVFQAEPAACAPVQQNMSAATRVDPFVGYLMTMCIARKIGAASLKYEISREVLEDIAGPAHYPG